MIQSLNIGTFDKNNPDIRYKKGLEKKESGLDKKDIRYKTNQLMPSKKAGRFYDNLGDEIDEGTFKLIMTYNKLLKKYFNSMKAHNYNAQYDLLDQLNGIAHRIKKKTEKYNGKPNTTYEDFTYPLKDKFAKSEVDRLGPDIITYDKNEKRYSITKPNGKKGGHLEDWVGEYANSKR